ncbi:elongation factor 1-alpha, putative [Babesia ovata]|uniref:Elongation factor 1-alpha, putative n=1 Tax=Babesia ovata TaxID=189622 RepID=A0A2H6KBC4_9APIC|nr:elongation factor 1-alpha, putative [Babesia ovata]GBE60284.1 elongation factor 1-alpha, putative [Babesia ovata]
MIVSKDPLSSRLSSVSSILSMSVPLCLRAKRGTGLLLLDALDDTDSNGLLHVTHGETTKGSVLRECLNDHGLARLQDDHSGVTVLDGLGVLLKGLTGTLVHTARDLVEFARDVSSVAVNDRGVTGLDGTRVVQDDDLGGEGHGGLGGVVLGVRSDVTSADVRGGDVLHVETNVVTRAGNIDNFVVHFDGFALSSDRVGGEGEDHTGLELTSLHTTNGDGTDTTDLVHTLEGKTQGLVNGPLRGLHHVEGLDQGLALVPRHVGGALNHVVTHETGDGHERHLLDVVTDLLQVTLNFLLDFAVTVLLVVALVHLVDGANDLLDTKGEGQKSVLTGLTFLREGSLETTSLSGHDKHSDIGLGGTRNHVLDEVTMSGGVNDGVVVLASFELPQGDIDGDTTLTLALQLVQDPGVLEGTLTHVGRFLLELLDGTLVNTTELVDQVTSGGGFTTVDVADNDQVNVGLLLRHLV